MAYREPLPPDCPPGSAVEITWRRIVYRLVRHNPPVDDDFRSRRAEKPDAPFRVTECQARGLSVFPDSSDAMRCAKIGRLQNTMLCEVTLDRGSGRILRTDDRQKGHHTWWPLADFDILANSRVV